VSDRYLIVNADDFGLSPGVNRGILAAHDGGIVTSASLMVRWPAGAQAAEAARSRPGLSLGLHVDLGEWSYRDGEWVRLYEVVPTGDRGALAAEVERQLALFRRFVGRDPTHLDSHQHVHHEEPLAGILADLARELGVPLRDRAPGIRYDGRFYGQSGRGEPFGEAITVDALTRLLVELPPGVTELGCHPGLGEDIESMYRAERDREVRTLSDPQVRAAVESERIRLCSFERARDVLNAPSSPP
jgi:predicted glycoside hydrolase/deacetylase ChbG (UPF0249 family)